MVPSVGEQGRSGEAQPRTPESLESSPRPYRQDFRALAVLAQFASPSGDPSPYNPVTLSAKQHPLTRLLGAVLSQGAPPLWPWGCPPSPAGSPVLLPGGGGRVDPLGLSLPCKGGLTSPVKGLSPAPA